MTTRRLLTFAPLQIIQALIGLGSIAVFTRLMTAEQFGEYALALSLSLAGHTLAFTWVQAAAFRFLKTAQTQHQTADHYATLLALAAGISLVTAVATGLLLAFSGLNEHALAITSFAVGAALMRFITRIARESDRAELAFNRYSIFETLYLLLGFAAGVAGLVIFDFGAAAPFAGLLVAGAFVAVFDLRRIATQAHGGVVSVARAQLYAAYGAPLAIALVVDLAVQALVRIILMHGAGAAHIGAFAAAFGLARPLDLLFAGLCAAFAPLMLSAYEERGAAGAREVAARVFAMLAAVTVPATFGLILVDEPLTALMVGESLRTEATLAAPWMAAAGLLSGFGYYFWSEAFQLAHRTGERALLMLAPAIAQLALTAWLAPTHGALGAAIAACAASALGLAVMASFGSRHLSMPMPWRDLARIAASTTAMTLAVLATPQGAGVTNLVLHIVVGAFTYLACATALDLFGARTQASAVLQAIARKVRAQFNDVFTDSTT